MPPAGEGVLEAGGSMTSSSAPWIAALHQETPRKVAAEPGRPAGAGRVCWQVLAARAGVAAGYSLLVAVLEIWLIVDVTDHDTTALDRLFIVLASATVSVLLVCVITLRRSGRR